MAGLARDQNQGAAGVRFNCGLSRQERHVARQQWHRWFAWRPVRVTGQHQCVWLETIERKGTFYHDCIGFQWSWEYRA